MQRSWHGKQEVFCCWADGRRRLVSDEWKGSPESLGTLKIWGAACMRRYLENVPAIVPLLEREYRFAAAKLTSTQAGLLGDCMPTCSSSRSWEPFQRDAFSSIPVAALSMSSPWQTACLEVRCRGDQFLAADIVRRANTNSFNASA